MPGLTYVLSLSYMPVVSAYFRILSIRIIKINDLDRGFQRCTRPIKLQNEYKLDFVITLREFRLSNSV
jgi:hypothetical protein